MDVHDDGDHRPDTSHKVGSARPGFLKWLLPLLVLLALLLVLAFCGDNDRDNTPDLVDQVGNNQPGNCGAGNEAAKDEGVGDAAPDDQNDCK